MLEVAELTKKFSGITAISNIQFSIEPGKIVGLVGPNGAGKTTLFNLISAVAKPTQGELKFNGATIVGLKPHQVCRLGIARTFQDPRTFPALTAAEFVGVAATFGSHEKLTQAQTREKARELLSFMALSEETDAPSRQLSAAKRRRLEIAAALATRPKLLLLDEPIAGLNPVEMQSVMEIIRRIRGEMGITVFWIEHVMRALMEVVDRVIVLHHGAKIAEGLPRELYQNQKVLDAYLGEGI
ncbi:MAG: ABC transporter ATP-binding protein [Nitrospinota bacterium]